MVKITKRTAVEKQTIYSLPTLRGDFKEGFNRNRVRLPKEVTEELAENVGIHISDGCMSGNSRTIEMTYSGHAIDDFPYYTFRFLPLLKRLWGTSRIGYKEVEGEQSLRIRIFSKQLVLFKQKVLGLPYGKKEAIVIPKYFLRDEQITRTVIRGLFDGDGCLTFKSKYGLGHTYPVISYGSVCEPLMRQLKGLIEHMGFTVPNKLIVNKTGTLVLNLNGDANYEKWMNSIGFNNPKHLTKVVLYENLGMVPPETDLVERVKLIRGDIALSEIYPMDDLRVNNNRITEKTVLKKLAKGVDYIRGLGRRAQLDEQCVRKALRRLVKMSLAELDKEKSKCNKKYYRITEWGKNKMRRAAAIVERLREEFNLAV